MSTATILQADDLWEEAIDPDTRAEWKRLDASEAAEQAALQAEFDAEPDVQPDRSNIIDLMHKLRPGHIYSPDQVTAISRIKPRTERWPHFTGAELHERVEEPLDFLPMLGQSGYIVKGASHVLASYPKAGKTELTTTCIRDWVKAGLNVVVFGEESDRVWSLRLKKADVDGLDNLHFWPALGMTTKDMQKAISRLVRIPDVVVIDTLRSLLGIEDENDSAQMSRAVQPWITYSQQTGCTLIVLHHTRKGGGKYGEGVSGGHGLIGAFDVILELNRDGDNNRRTIGVMGRLIEPQTGVYERNEILTDHGAGTGRYEMTWLGVNHEVTRADVQDRVKSVLLDIAQTTSDIREAIGDPKPSVDTVNRALVALVGLGLAQRYPRIGEEASGRKVTWTAS